MSTAAILVLALVLDAVLGEPKWLWSRVPHPAVAMGKGIDLLDRALNTGSNRRAKGVLTLIAIVAVALLVGCTLSFAGPAVEVLTGAILLAQRSLSDHVRDVSRGLLHSIDEGRRMVSRIVSRDCAEMSEAQVARSAIESAAENLSDGVVAPAFWLLIGGLPGLLVYKAVNTADSMIGYRNERYEAFGWASARFDDLLNLIPARLTGAMIAALANLWPQWSDIASDARRHRSPNAGWPEAAMARALDVALAGPRSYDGQVRDLAWVNGQARRDIGAQDIDKAVDMLWLVWNALLAGAVAITLLTLLF